MKRPQFHIVPWQAIDVWMNACTAFIFAALIEFTFVNYWYRKQATGHGDGGGGYNPVYGGRGGDVNGDGIELVSCTVIASVVRDKMRLSICFMEHLYELLSLWHYSTDSDCTTRLSSLILIVGLPRKSAPTACFNPCQGRI